MIMNAINYNKVTSITFLLFEQIVGKENISSDKEQLEKYGQDETEDLIFFAEVILKPSSVKEISQIAKICNEHIIPLTVRGAGTGLSGGALPIKGGVLLSMEKFNTKGKS